MKEPKMKKNFTIWGILCLALVLGLSACGDAKDESTPLEGTWEADGEKYIFSGKNCTYLGGYFSVKGTFTLEGDKIKTTATQMSGDGGKTWVALSAEMKELMGGSDTWTSTYKLSADKKTLTIDGEDYKKV
jgi:hypothetical protein